MQTANTDIQTVPQADSVKTSLNLPADVYEALRKHAFDNRVQQQQVVADALRKHLEIPQPGE